MKRFCFILSLMALLMLSGAVSYAQDLRDASYRTLGYIKSDGTVQDASYRTVGHIKSDGTIQDASYRTVGYIRSDGTVQDSSYRTIGHASGVSPRSAAWYFFFR